MSDDFDDVSVFGENVYVYCNQHLAPHRTGWCTVSNHNKVALGAANYDAAVDECRAKGFTLYSDLAKLL